MPPAPDKPVEDRPGSSSYGGAVGAGRIAVVVPGILGSILYYEDDRGRLELWGENMIRNYFRIRDDATVIRWERRPANSSLLKSVFPYRRIGWPKVRLWDGLLGYLRDHREFGEERIVEFSYDWRQCLLETAEQLGRRLSENERVLTSEGVSPGELRYTFFTHSMGGLVVRIALALGVVDPARVDRLVHLGSPLLGAPAAFNSIYGDGPLPAVQELMDILGGHALNPKNKGRFTKHLLKQLRTFPSVYQLMPPTGRPYLTTNNMDQFNPLDANETVIRGEMREKVAEAHYCLQEATALISEHGVGVTNIYGVRHRRRTDERYRVEVIERPDPYYRVRELVGHTERGDGTVPELSARGPDERCQWIGIDDIGHMYLCNDSRVLRHLRIMEAEGAFSE